uniref:EF-hand domain-containing protein n=1 Tax=Hemiselmis tepida TaxID=464990 RepID=A0A7S0YS44_9CRYP|mmetsp:Transcript_16003/g.40573  ORF Transcript_16003/g.40573 Transcript_16003/m.40573 type:complete len:210 (+) Transcript_16003:56-685(+)|eukprot:CAMPEP_0174938830 /NCGR_PEP_ID=MMETSP1355-20121228/64725_1 /TAXON_ID=464990 /ORGANISM="Hemiselmis tepida, Strain CCMP443" /LENGTH=209 /DNA_ID=CAMNT_0016185789 /DNA_START=1 /DNA_END=630 /DNA_ORIENTATION=+
MYGAAAAAVTRRHRTRPSNVGASRKKSYEEQEKFWSDLEHQNKLKKVLRKYDTEKTGFLERKELGEMLTDLNDGEAPSDEEVLWVLRVADSKNQDVDDRLDVTELDAAIETWNSYLANRTMIADAFRRYDTNNSGKLEAHQLKAFLASLNDGVVPTDEEVSLVMDKADGYMANPTGGINRTELLFAISIWYTHSEEMRSCFGKKKCAVM